MWDRDLNAARNMRIVYCYAAEHGGQRPDAFTRGVALEMPAQFFYRWRYLPQSNSFARTDVAA